MLATVKEIGIFVVIAQAILFLVPKESYTKYVKALIGIMIITKIVSPVFSLLSEEGWEEIVFSVNYPEEELQNRQGMLQGEDGYDNLMMHYAEMAEEQGSQMQQEGTGDE